ncbi:MAG: SUMF1/EgtB/PvdO family nonheme iron enzyme [Chitinophagales bacterium]|nr:SUMF1/EgtB/PvdO family nonheme iron enzyme [Chitinophagales bacterium]
MKKVTLSLYFTIFVFIIFAQLDINTINKRMVKIDNNLFIDKYETSNADYNLFLDYLKAKNEAQYLEASVKSSYWTEMLNHGESFDAYYNTHKAYNKYPVVNISFEAAEAYCQWLTEQYNNSDERKYNKVVFKLPSENEWTLAANGGNDKLEYPWGSHKISNNKGYYYCNFVIKKDADIKTVTAPVHSYKKTVTGLYNISGNVAEMTNKNGTAIGGSWNDDSSKMKINTSENISQYTHPMPTVGFRVAMEIVQE